MVTIPRFSFWLRLTKTRDKTVFSSERGGETGFAIHIFLPLVVPSIAWCRRHTIGLPFWLQWNFEKAWCCACKAHRRRAVIWESQFRRLLLSLGVLLSTVLLTWDLMLQFLWIVKLSKMLITTLEWEMGFFRQLSLNVRTLAHCCTKWGMVPKGAVPN